MILLGVVDEVLPGEEAALDAARCQCLWHTGQHAGVLACQYLIAVERAPISQNSDVLVSCRLLRPECHRYELCTIMGHVGNVVVFHAASLADWRFQFQGRRSSSL